MGCGRKGGRCVVCCCIRATVCDGVCLSVCVYIDLICEAVCLVGGIFARLPYLNITTVIVVYCQV